MAKKVLPKKVYVYIVYGNGNEWWLSAEPTAEGCAEKGEKRLVGVYELVEKLNITLEIKEEIIVSKA